MNTKIISNMATLAVMKALNTENNSSQIEAQAINIPGTVVGNLRNATETNKYRDEFWRYNNYLTDIFGAAQMAADRYMSLKERIPMQIEYYLTPNEKKSITMYINPEKLDVSTNKIHSKTVTRGGIYYHIYGDDVWNLSFSGTCGYSQMRGIEALEEVYHYSGTLLKYTNVKQSTVHTNQISSGSGMSGSGLNFGFGMESALSEGLKTIADESVGAKVMDALGIASDATADSLGTNSGKAGASFLEKMIGSVVSNGSGFSLEGLAETVSQTVAGDYFDMAEHVTGNANNISGMINVLTDTSPITCATSQIVPALVTDIITSSVTGSANQPVIKTITESLTGGINKTMGNMLSLLTGDKSYMSHDNHSNLSTAGHYYTMKTLATAELNQIVKSAQRTSTKFKDMYKKAASNWSDIEDMLKDPYLPRLTTIYFDDRVYIGFFKKFTWSRHAETLLINYSVDFEVLRMVVLQRDKVERLQTGSIGTARQSLLSVAASWGIGQLFGTNSNKRTNSNT